VPEPNPRPPRPQDEAAPDIGDDPLAAFLVDKVMEPEVTARKARQGDPIALETVGGVIKKTAAESDTQRRLQHKAHLARVADIEAGSAYKIAVREFQKLNKLGHDVYQLAKSDPNLAYANTPELQAAAQRVLEVGRQKANTAIARKKVSALVNSAEAAAIFEVVAQIRELAEPGDLKVKKIIAPDPTQEEKTSKMLASVTRLFPKSWVKASNESGILGRHKPLAVAVESKDVDAGKGQYHIESGRIALGKLDRGLLTHELSHRFENVVPGILAAEEKYWKYRANDAKPVSNYLGRRNFFGHADEYRQKYSGRIYLDFGQPYAFELLTTGMQQMTHASHTWDDALTSWTLGTLVSL
jgi:hypothetical protein